MNSRILAAGVAIVSTFGAARAERVYALVTTALGGEALVYFDSATPLLTSLPVSIVGMREGEVLRGVDFRPRDGRMYGLGSTDRVYRIDPATGSAQQVSATGAVLEPASEGDELDLDFNPRVDLIRLVSDAGQNLRVSPVTGLVTAVDGELMFASDDVHVGEAAEVVGAGYTNAYVFARTTTLYDIEAGQDVLVRQDPPNDGVLRTVGALGVDVAGAVGFDISPDGAAYMSVRPIPALPLSVLYTVNLTTGAATAAGTIGVNYVRDLAVELFCPVDINRDRQVDFFDYLDFVQAFSDESDGADFNRDGQIDFFDYLDFVAMYDEGC